MLALKNELITIVGKDGWIDCCKVWNEWMNWLLQGMEWTDELIAAIYWMNS